MVLCCCWVSYRWCRPREKILLKERERATEVNRVSISDPATSAFFRRIIRSQLRVNILYFYVEFCINFYFFYLIICPLLLNISYCLVNYAVVASCCYWMLYRRWLGRPLVYRCLLDLQLQRRRLTTQQYTQRPVTTPRLHSLVYS